jgi:hypothetical protein
MGIRTASILHGLLVLLVSVFVLGIAPAQAEDRVALVIGNGAYRNAPMLPNPQNDAADTAAALERLGFAVTRVSDGSFEDLRHALIGFGAKARRADVALIYFAGHGMEVGGENWLIPVDAQLQSDVDVENEAIGLKSFMLAVGSAKSLGLVILDACRNNPFAVKMQRTDRTRSVERGLAAIEPADNVLVAFAAKDGTTASDGTGRNSPFTAALLKYIDKPGLEINFLFRNVRDEVLDLTQHQQQPFVYGSLSKEAFYLVPPPASAPSASDAPGADEIAWAFLRETNDASTLRRFMAQFPTSAFVADAQKRIASLEQAASPSSEPPSAPGTTTEPGLSSTTTPAVLQPPTLTAMAASPGPDPQRIALRFQSNTPQIDAAWNLVKTSTDPTMLRRFTDQYPDPQRKTIVKAMGGDPKEVGVLRALRADQMHAVLEDYGTFVQYPKYGEVWVPSVTLQGWHPYEPCHWVNTRTLGWYYLDKTPWGAIVHHYGRWAHDPKLGWMWVAGTDFSPGWVVWRTSPTQIGWAPMPPSQDIATLSAETFDNADEWTFMDVATFDRGCSATAVASAAKVPSLMRNTTIVRQVRFAGGIEVVVLPDTVAGPYVDLNIAFDPWPAWIFGQILNAWNSVWNLATATAALCPPNPTVLPTAPAHKPTAAPPLKLPASPSPPPPPPPPPPPATAPKPRCLAGVYYKPGTPCGGPITRKPPLCSGLGGRALYLCQHPNPQPPRDPCAGLAGRALYVCRYPGAPGPRRDPCAGLGGRALFLCQHPRPRPDYGVDDGNDDGPCIGPDCGPVFAPSIPLPGFGNPIGGFGSRPGLGSRPSYR